MLDEIRGLLARLNAMTTTAPPTVDEVDALAQVAAESHRLVARVLLPWRPSIADPCRFQRVSGTGMVVGEVVVLSDRVMLLAPLSTKVCLPATTSIDVARAMADLILRAQQRADYLDALDRLESPDAR